MPRPGNPSLKITVQPVECFRFRYPSEKGSHGALTGVGTEKKSKKFPTVKIENWKQSRDVTIRASLYTVNEEPTEHVNDLIGKDCKDGKCYVKLKKDMTAEFSSMTIYMKKKEEILKILTERKKTKLGPRAMKNKHFDKESFEAEIAEEAKNINMHAARICFEAFYTDTSDRICEPVFSDPIHNPKETGDLRITRLSKVYGSSTGGDEVILLCDKVKKDNIEIRFYDVNEEGNIENMQPIGIGHFSPADVHYQYAIYFRTPCFNKQEETDIKIVLFRPSDEKFGEPIGFKCIPDDNSFRKRKRCSSSENYPETSSTSSSVQSNSNEFFSSDSNMAALFDNLEFDLLEPEEDYGLCKNVAESPFVSDFDVKSIEDIPFGYITDILPILENQAESSGLTGISSDFADPSLPLYQNLDFQNPGQPQSALSSQIRAEMFPVGYDIFRTPSTSSPNEDSSSLKPKGHLEVDAKVYLPKPSKEMDKQKSKVRKLEEIRNKLKCISRKDINTPNKFKETLLHLATRNNQRKLLRHFLLRGGDLTFRNGNGENCIHIAAKNGHNFCLETILQTAHNRIQNVQALNCLNYDGFAPIHLSILSGSEESIKLLLKNGANVNTPDGKCGQTPLQLAINEKLPSFVSIILSQPDVDVLARDFGGHTSIYFVCDVNDLPYEKTMSQIENDDGDFFENSLKFLRAFYGVETLEDKFSGTLQIADAFETKSNDDLDQNNCELKNDSLPVVLNENSNCEKDNILSSANESKENETERNASLKGKLCRILDNDAAWKILCLYLGFEQSHIEKFEILDSSPTNAVLQTIRNNNTDYMNILKKNLFLAKDCSPQCYEAYKVIDEVL